MNARGAGLPALRGRMPVRTGRLKRSLRIEQRGGAVIVRAGVDYAIFVRGARAGFFHWRQSAGVRRMEFDAARLALEDIVRRIAATGGGLAITGRGGFNALPGFGAGQTPLPAAPIF